MKISKQARRDAKQLFRGCAVGGLLDENRVRQTVQQVIARKPRGYVGILSHLHRLVKLDLDRRTARVESAVALPADLESGIAAKLNQIYGAGLSLSFAANPALIGGLRIKVGSDVYDDSVQARLAALQETF
ncbi:MAG: F0F1 ATP synthase subunit delta [Verrucomicrobia bacterium]|nr:F0F1 ATP synthase subunit delta [Verrucomicrobiota bacterium]